MHVTREQSKQGFCVLPIFEGHAALFPSACEVTKLLQPSEVRICCPSDALLSIEASAVWESGKRGIYSSVKQDSFGRTTYIGDRGNVIGGGFYASHF